MISRRIVIIAAAVAAAFFLAAYVAYWFIVAGEIRASAGAWMEDRRADGYAVESGPVAVGGFPAAFRVSIEEFAIGAPNGDWRAATARIEAAPASVFSLEVWDAAPAGEVLAVIATASGPVELTLEGARLLTRTRGGALRRAEAYLDAATLAAPEPLLMTEVFGDRLEDVSLVLTQAPDADAVTIESAFLRWGEAEFGAQGALGVDETGHLAGMLNLGLSQPERFLEALGEAGVMGEAEMRFARAGLAIAPRNEDGHVVLPFAFQNGTAYVGPAPIGDAPLVHAPESNS